jgi:hypothetical protein
MKRYYSSLALLLLSSAVCAQEQPQQSPYLQERVFTSELDLSQWCEQEAKARYVAKNITPYQWTSRYYNRSNVLYVEGKLRADSKDVEVRCRAANGARERYATVEIDDPSLR